MAQMHCDDEARGGVCTGDNGDLAMLDEMYILKAGVGVFGAEQDFIVLLEPKSPDVGVKFSFHLTFTEQCGLPASIS